MVTFVENITIITGKQMMKSTSTVCVLTLCVLLSSAGFAEESKTQRVDFKNDLIPVFTKNGCNAGACHGAAIGRGGFKLSLYGGNPEADYIEIVRRVRGRRVNLAKPERSLIVLKPAEHIEHGGGTIFDIEDVSARLLIDWIKQGGTDASTRSLKRVEITPRKHIAKTLGESITPRAVAHYSDGTSRDVTKWTIFKAEDSSAVKINEQSRMTILRRGRHIVVARYLSQVVPIEVVAPLTDSRVDLASEPRRNFIDEEILATLETLGLRPSPQADDATFVRRLSLDLTGRLPISIKGWAAETQGKVDRAALVDKLLRSNEFTEYWTLQLAKLLRIRPQGNDVTATTVYHHWLAAQIRDNVSYKKLARTLITSSGDSHTIGPANFYRTVAGAREQAEFMSELFMGSRLRCANCHNHPLDRWTQDDYHGLAAIFAKVESGKVIKEKPRGKVIHPRTGEPATGRIPGEYFLAEDAENSRNQLADWLTDSKNPYFAKAIVNRLWKRMMGRGLVEPADDFRATNPATHPALLDKLAEDFVANDYDLRHTLKVIASSAVYARSAYATKENKDDDRFYSHALRRPLEPEVLADAISDVLGVSDQYGDQPQGTRAVALINSKTPSRTLDVLGRCGRDDSCESPTVTAGGLPQKLHLFNGELLNARIAKEGSRLQKMLATKKKPMEVVEAFYFAAFNRQPIAEERSYWSEQLKRVNSADSQQTFLEDFVWAVLTCNEFVTNH